MRGIAKGHPPGEVSPQAERDFLAELPDTAEEARKRARTAFDDLHKLTARGVLRNEQGGLCVYCERRLTTESRVADGRPAPRIDHWRPISLHPQLAFHWKNLYLSCTTQATCDSRKGETPLVGPGGAGELPWPVDHPYERCLGFTSMGEVYVRSDAPVDAAQRDALVLAVGVPHDDRTKDNGILNLNHPTLVAARAAAVDAERTRLRLAYPGATASRQDRERQAQRALQDRPMEHHVSVRVGWLIGSLGGGR